MYLRRFPENPLRTIRRQMRVRAINCRPSSKKPWFARTVFHGSAANRPRGIRFCSQIFVRWMYTNARRRLQMFVRNRRFMDTCLYETSGYTSVEQTDILYETQYCTTFMSNYASYCVLISREIVANFDNNL